jgi:hypothetical protein
MATRARETSADSAARFLESRSAAAAKSAEFRLRRRMDRARATERRLSRGPAAPAPATSRGPRRIVLDFAEPTLRLIHETLCERVTWAEDVGDKLNLLLIAEQMVAAALGEPPCDDPPLTDREAQ